MLDIPRLVLFSNMLYSTRKLSSIEYLGPNGRVSNSDPNPIFRP